MIAGGAEGRSALLGVGGFAAMKALSTATTTPPPPPARGTKAATASSSAKARVFWSWKNSNTPKTRRENSMPSGRLRHEFRRHPSPPPTKVKARCAVTRALKDAGLNVARRRLRHRRTAPLTRWATPTCKPHLKRPGQKPRLQNHRQLHQSMTGHPLRARPAA